MSMLYAFVSLQTFEFDVKDNNGKTHDQIKIDLEKGLEEIKSSTHVTMKDFGGVSVSTREGVHELPIKLVDP